jgi:hypothetical protein
MCSPSVSLNRSVGDSAIKPSAINGFGPHLRRNSLDERCVTVLKQPSDKKPSPENRYASLPSSTSKSFVDKWIELFKKTSASPLKLTIQRFSDETMCWILLTA